MSIEKPISRSGFLDEMRNEGSKCEKRRLSFENHDASTIFKGKKVSRELDLHHLRINDPRFIHYEDRSDYVEISANPEFLPSTPKIFHKEFPKKKEVNVPDDFFVNYLTFKSFNSNVGDRFSPQISKGWKTEKDHIKIDNSMKNKVDCSSTMVDSYFGIKNQKKKKSGSKVGGSVSQKSDESKSGKNETSHVDMFKVCQKKALIFHMHHPSQIIFHGEIKVTLISGEIQILGFTLSNSSEKKTVNVYSPNFCTPLRIESKPPKEIRSTDEIKSDLLGILTEEDTNLLVSTIKPDDSVLMVERIVSNFGIVINKYFDKQLFPKDLENISSLSESSKTVQGMFNFKPTKKIKGIKKNPQWEYVELDHCTVLCGGKGAGKSTLLRYYINKLVTQNEKVLCLDFDPGQPEFTPPGFLSGVVVDTPLLGPNFTHLIDPKVMVFFGAVDVCVGPTKYLEYIKYIVEYCRNNEELLKMKWLVNTIGFNKGVGIELMTTILKLIKPDTVIQLKCSDRKRNYPFYFTTTKVNSRKSFRSMVKNEVPLSFKLHVINSCAERVGKKGEGRLKPSELRDIQLISYFSQMISPPYYNFSAVQPYLISFSKLYLGVDHLIPPNDILKAFNGNLVALLNFQPSSEEILTSDTNTSDYFKIVVKQSVTPCIGLGFVRGIDCTEKKFYVITHLPVEALENVNCLSLGKINPPHSMFLKQDTIKGQAVYTSFSTVDTIQSIKRMFRVPTPHQSTAKDLYDSHY